MFSCVQMIMRNSIYFTKVVNWSRARHLSKIFVFVFEGSAQQTSPSSCWHFPWFVGALICNCICIWFVLVSDLYLYLICICIWFVFVSVFEGKDRPLLVGTSHDLWEAWWLLKTWKHKTAPRPKPSNSSQICGIFNISVASDSRNLALHQSIFVC